MARQVATFKMAIASRVKMQIDNNVDMTRVSSSVRHMPQIMWDKPKNTPNINSTPIQKKSRATNQGGCLILFLRELDLVYHVSSLDWGYASCWNEVDDDGARSSVCKWSRGISIKCSFVKRYCTSCRMIYSRHRKWRITEVMRWSVSRQNDDHNQEFTTLCINVMKFGLWLSFCYHFDDWPIFASPPKSVVYDA